MSPIIELRGGDVVREHSSLLNTCDSANCFYTMKIKDRITM